MIDKQKRTPSASVFRMRSLLCFCLVLAFTKLAAEPSLTLDDVIARNTDAMGGKEKIESLRSVEISLHIKDPTFEVDGIYHAARPGKMRIDIMAAGNGVARRKRKKAPCLPRRYGTVWSCPETYLVCMSCKSAGIALSWPAAKQSMVLTTMSFTLLF